MGRSNSRNVDISFLDRENDPEILRELMRVVLADNARLFEKVEELRRAEEKVQQEQLNLVAKYALLRRDYFGRGREKFAPKNEDRARGQMELLIHARSLVPSPEKKDTPNLEQEVRRHVMSDDQLDAELRDREPDLAHDFKASWKELAHFTENSIELTLIERRFIEILHERQKYKAKVVLPSGDEKEIIIAAPGPERLLPGCTYGIAMAVAVATDKYQMHLPLERQRRAFASQGLRNISVKTLWNLCWAVGEHLRPIAQSIRGEILTSNLCVHADETPWPIQGKDDNGYLWSISNMAGSYYAFEPTRSGKIIAEVLDDFTGVVMSDGYAGYNRLSAAGAPPGAVQLAHCWAHVRRKFFQIEETKPGGVAVEILTMIDELFSLERRAKDFADLKNIREDDSSQLVAKIKIWCEEQWSRHLPESQVRKAIAYTLKLWSGLTIFLNDARVPLSNNDAERTLRHAVVGRKNYYGSKTIDGADLAATLFTVIESCKRVELDPRSFIEMAVRASARGENPPTPLQHARKTRTTTVAA